MRLLLDMLKAIYWFDDALQENLELAGFTRLSRTKSFIFANVAIGERRAVNIARNLGLSRQAVSLMLAELAELGFIAFEPDPEDGRARLVMLADPKLRAAARQILGDLEAELGRRIGNERLKAMQEGFGLNWGPLPFIPLHHATREARAVPAARRTGKRKAART